MSASWRGVLLVLALSTTARDTWGFAFTAATLGERRTLLLTRRTAAEGTATEGAATEGTSPDEAPPHSGSWLDGALDKGVFGYEGIVGVRGRGQRSVSEANNGYAAAGGASGSRPPPPRPQSGRSRSDGTGLRIAGLKMGPAACMTCVKYEDCNFVKLACAKGHTWRAVPGSPVCFECPACKRASLSSRPHNNASSSSSSSGGSAPQLRRAVRKPLVSGLPPESVRTLGELKALAALQGGTVVAVDVASAWQRRRRAVGGVGGAGGGDASRKAGEEASQGWSAAARDATAAAAAATAKAAHLHVDAAPVPLEADVLWACAAGHRWTARARNVAKNQWWCPQCAAHSRHDAKGRLTLADMQVTAAAKGGQCLSEEYLGSAVKLLWRCAWGHVFWQSPNHVRRKEDASWCKECTRRTRRKA